MRVTERGHDGSPDDEDEEPNRLAVVQRRLADQRRSGYARDSEETGHADEPVGACVDCSVERVRNLFERDPAEGGDERAETETDDGVRRPRRWRREVASETDEKAEREGEVPTFGTAELHVRLSCHSPYQSWHLDPTRTAVDATRSRRRRGSRRRVRHFVSTTRTAETLR